MKRVFILNIYGIFLVGLSYASIIYFKNNQNTMSSQQDFFILAEHNGATIITSLRSKITPLINLIIQQELNLSCSDKSPRFKTPPHHNLTLYYIFDWINKTDILLTQVIDSAFSNNTITAFDVMFGQPAFFGIHNDEIVVKINDPKNLLSKINIMIKHALANSHELYNVKKSEYFPYVPHIALGRLPTNDKHYFSSSDGLKHLNNIKRRIEQEVFPIIAQALNAAATKLHVNSWCIYNVQQKIKIKNIYMVENTTGYN